jgi:hypothetical protein
MRLVPILLINLATVVVALVVYDQVRGKTYRSSQGRASTPRSQVIDATAIGQRLDALEAERSPPPWSPGTDAGLDGSDESELGNAASGSLAAKDPTPAEATPTEVEPPAAAAYSYVPRADDIRRFRQLREAVRREDSIEKNRARVDGALNKLSLRLTKTQRSKIHHAFAAVEPRVTRIWIDAKTQAQKTIAAGGEVDRGEIVTSTTAVIQQEFANTLTAIVDHPADAEEIAKSLMPGGR